MMLELPTQVGEPRMIVCCLEYVEYFKKRYPTRKVEGSPYMNKSSFTVMRKYPKGAFHVRIEKENPGF